MIETALAISVIVNVLLFLALFGAGAKVNFLNESNNDLRSALKRKAKK